MQIHPKPHNETMGSFNTSFVFMHTREALDISAYD
jgi:hypothetical protein